MNPRYRSQCVDFVTSSDDRKLIKFELPEPTYIEYIHVYGKPYAEAGLCADTMSNRYFYQRKYRISPNDDWSDPQGARCNKNLPNDLIDFAHQPDLSLIYPTGNCSNLKRCYDLSVLNGDATKCNSTIKNKYFFIQTMWTDYPFSVCGVGIFTCYCSNYVASRESTFQPTKEEFDFSSLKASSATTISRNIDFTLPTYTGECRNACTISMNATVDQSIAQYIKASVV